MKALMKTEEKKKKGRLKLKEYPYTYARISAMKSKLIKKDTYTKLMKMKISEIAKFLQEMEYKKEIDELASKYSGVKLIENALNANMIRTFLKLKRISEDETLSELIDTYMMRRDIWNIKTILRGKHSRHKDEEINDLVLPVGILTGSFLSGLVKKESVEEIVKSLDFIEFENLRNALPAYREKKSLFELENAIDHDYYSHLLEFSKRMPRQGEFFRNFVENEIDTLNIKVLLRLRKEKIDKKDVGKYLLYPGARLSRLELDKLAEKGDFSAMMRFLQRAGYRKLAGEMEKKKESLVAMELLLNKYLLDRVVLLLHQHPLSVDVIMGYLFAKEIEIKNLKTIIKGKQLGLKEDFIEGELVVGG